MTDTLFDLSLKVARELQLLTDGVATGGSTTTLIDTNDRTEADNYWQDGCMWLWYDAGGASAAPEGQFSVINSSTSSTGTLNLRTTLTAGIASGDRYSLVRKIANTNWLDVIIQKINQALTSLGPIPIVDTTTISIETARSEYTLPIRANQALRRVLIQKNTIDADDNQWIDIYNYEVYPATAGNPATLRLPAQYPTGNKIMLLYLDYHPALQVYSDVLSDHVAPERIVYRAALECAKWRKSLTGWNRWDDLIARLEQQANAAELKYPINIPAKPGKINMIYWRDEHVYSGEEFRDDTVSLR